MATESPSPQRPSRHVCPDCGRSYKAVETLNRHRKNHSELTNYECEVCDASFKRKDLLDRHMHIHSDAHFASQSHRSARACVRCSRLKTRCDNASPCSRCVRGNHDCVYRDSIVYTRPAKAAGITARSRQNSSSDVNNETYGLDLMSVQATAPMTTLDGIFTSGAADVDWTLDNSWLENLPAVAPLSFGDAAGGHTIRGTGTGMLWDFTAMSPTDYRSTPNASTDTYFAFTPQNTHWSQHPWADQQTTAPMMPAATIAMDIDARPPSQSSMGQMGMMGMTQSPHGAPIAATNGIASTVPPTRDHVVTELTKVVLDLQGFYSHTKDRVAFWQYAANNVESAFGIKNMSPGEGHILEQFIAVFYEKFNIRFPFVWKKTCDLESIPPYLYLTKCAIGAAFGDAAAVEFYSQTVDAMMQKLVLMAMQYELPDGVGFSICQCLTLMQASMLFFGHRKSFFTQPQQAGVAVMLLARRINLFNEGGPHHLERYLEETSPTSEEMKKWTWIEKQLRRRLAMAILRLEVFISILMGTRPLVSYEEINLHIPLSDTLWLRFNDMNDPSGMNDDLIDNEKHTLSDLVRIALDKDEPLPNNLQPYHLENILYGLQHYVWRFSQDPNLGVRFDIDFEEEVKGGSMMEDGLGHDLLDFSRRGMNDLKNDYFRTVTALRKWKAALTSTAHADHLMIERKTLLASHLLYNVSFMRLKADLASLHRLALRCIKDEQLPASQLAAAHAWSTSKRGAVVLEHACSTWLLITNELRRPPTSRAEFNILSAIALLHAAVIIWIYAGTHSEPGEATLERSSASAASGHATNSNGSGGGGIHGSGMGMGGAASATDLRLYRGNNSSLMQNFAKLLSAVQPMRPGVRTSAYHHTIATLAHRPLPLMGSP